MNSTTRTIRTGARGLCSALLLVLGAAEVRGEGDSAADATAEVSEVMHRVLEISGTRDLDAADRRARVEQLAMDRFAWTTMSRLVLARNWRKLTDIQQTEFVDAFQQHLAMVYGRRLGRIGDETIEVSQGRVASNGDVTVRTTVHGGEADGVVIAYRLRATDGQWKVIDVIIEGVSLVSNFRAQMKEIVNNSGTDSLIAKLRGKSEDKASD